MFRMRLMLCLIPLLLTNCANGQESHEESFCLKAHAIYLSSADHLTQSTAREILAHNRQGRQDCGWPQAN